MLLKWLRSAKPHTRNDRLTQVLRIKISQARKNTIVKRIIFAISLVAVVSSPPDHIATHNQQTLTKASVSYQSFDMLRSFA